VNRDTMGVNSLPKTVTRQRHDCNLNPGPSVPESSTLTTRLLTHPICHKIQFFGDNWHTVSTGHTPFLSVTQSAVSMHIANQTKLSTNLHLTFLALPTDSWGNRPIMLVLQCQYQHHTHTHAHMHTHTHTHSPFFQDYPGEPVPER